jgi:uncharacterized protein
MLFEWDHQKNKINLSKHKVSFELAATVFDDPLHLSVLDKKLHSEERWVTIGRTVIDSTVVVIHIYRHKISQEITRIISARKATKREKKQYEEGI